MSRDFQQHEFEHTDVASYALGVLDERDRRAFEAHLSGCRFCTMELADLRGMRAVLRGVEPPPSTTVSALPTRTGRRRRRGVQQWIVSAAAGFVLILAGVMGGVALSERGAVPGIDMSRGEQRSAVDAASGASGTAVLDDRGWGTWMALELGNVKGPYTCELVAVTKSGVEKVASGWAVPAKGYGVPGSPGKLKVEGGVADRLGEIDRLEVRTGDGQILLVIPV